MTVPLIGITTGVREEKRLYAVSVDYVHAIERANGVPVLIPPFGEEALQCVGRLDGLLLTGGPDIEPGRYGGSMHEAVYGVNPVRDASEIAVLREAMRLGLPVLGICRGAQLINVAHGGTLIEHLAGDGGVLHRTDESNGARHPVEIAHGTILAEVVGRRVIEPVSFHHQAVRELGAGLQVAAVAPDGVIEAIVNPECAFCVGVQWHPEMTAAEDPVQQAIFDSFVKVAAKRPTGDV